MIKTLIWFQSHSHFPNQIVCHGKATHDPWSAFATTHYEPLEWAIFSRNAAGACKNRFMLRFEWRLTHMKYYPFCQVAGHWQWNASGALRRRPRSPMRNRTCSQELIWSRVRRLFALASHYFHHCASTDHDLQTAHNRQVQAASAARVAAAWSGRGRPYPGCTRCRGAPAVVVADELIDFFRFFKHYYFCEPNPFFTRTLL